MTEIIRTRIAGGCGGGTSKLPIIPVQELPDVSTAKNGAIYIVPAKDGEHGDMFEEYIVVDGAWELIGRAKFDTEDFIKKIDDTTARLEKLIEETKNTADDIKNSSDSIADTLEAIKGSGDIPAATVAQVAENTERLVELGNIVTGSHEIIRHIIPITDEVTTANPRNNTILRYQSNKTTVLNSSSYTNNAVACYKVFSGEKYAIRVPKATSITLAVSIWGFTTAKNATQASLTLDPYGRISDIEKGNEWTTDDYLTFDKNGYLVVNYDLTGGEPIVERIEIIGDTGLVGEVESLEGSLNEVENRTSDLENGVVRGDINALNPQSEWLPKMMAAKKRYYTSSYTSEPNSIVFAHLSDVHGNWNAVSRFLEFCDKYSNYINMKVQTGDLVASTWDDDTDGYFSTPGAKNIVNIIGNHDTRDGSSTNWRRYIGSPAYERFIAPSIANWGVVHDGNTSHCYFYKDFSSAKLRAVFVDIMGYDDDENTWLQGLLEDANINSLHVVIFTHCAGLNRQDGTRVFSKIACKYSSRYAEGSDSTNLNIYNPNNGYKLAETVDAFQQGGGVFVGYIQGHYHMDFIAKVEEFPRQFIFAVSGSKSGELRDWKHELGTKNEDDFQIVAIETHMKIVKLFKVGANIDAYGIRKESICFSYDTNELIAES